uniref:TLDc domain-containing protein n=1 Tax=Steinernema glaseri TaxID=37863 RepID=A0A1I7YK76_9BILA
MKHYHHDSQDDALLSTTIAMGTPLRDQSFAMDTSTADMELYLCPSATSDDGICFNSYRSSSFKKVDGKTASDILDVGTPAYVKPVLFIVE